MHSVNYINCNIIENLINKVLDVNPLVPFIITEYANSLTNTSRGEMVPWLVKGGRGDDKNRVELQMHFNSQARSVP